MSKNNEMFKLEYILPEHGLQSSSTRRLIHEALTRAKGYKKSYLLGYPGSSPLPVAVEAHKHFLSVHANNIGTHTSRENEVGFSVTQRLEVASIHMLAQLFGGTTAAIDGYITGGGTEGNIFGLWMSRNIAEKQGKTFVVLHSDTAHYSIQKAIDILGVRSRSVCVDAAFQYDVSNLQQILKDLLAESSSFHICIVATLGQTMTGAYDDISVIINSVQKVLMASGATYDVHVDAAHGGFLLPFLDRKEANKLFKFSEVKSLSIDPHKLGLIPYNCGAVLYRKGRQKSVATKAPYLHSDTDDTLSGSRSGAVAASLYFGLLSKGRDGYTKIWREATATKVVLLSKLQNTGLIEWYFSDPRSNIISCSFKRLLSEEVENKYGITAVRLYAGGKTRHVYKLVIMPHVTRETLEEFIRDISKSRSG